MTNDLHESTRRTYSGSSSAGTFFTRYAFEYHYNFLDFLNFITLHFFQRSGAIWKSHQFASLVNEAAKAQAGVLIAKGYIHERLTAYWKFNLTIAVYVVRVKSYVIGFFNRSCVPMRVLMNELNLVQKRIAAGRITVFWNGRRLRSSLGLHTSNMMDRFKKAGARSHG